MSGNHDRPAAPLRPERGFVWRTPLLPVDEFLAWREELTAADVPGEADEAENLARLDAVLAADRARLRERLAQAVDRPEIREALYLASPRIEAAIEAWRADPESKRGRRVERSLVRYLTRMTTRPTPFGLCAGVSTGTLGERTRLELAGRDEYRRDTQVDADVLHGIASALAHDAAMGGEARLHPNDSCYRAAGQVRFVQASQDGPRRSHRLAALPDRTAVRTVLARAAHGATATELADALAGDGHDPQSARRFVDRLVDRQLLVPDVALPVTAAAPTAALVDALAAHESTAETAQHLAEVTEALDKLDAAGLGAAPGEYRAITERLGGLPGVDTPDDPFHAVLTKPAVGASLGPHVIGAFERGLDILHAQVRLAEDPLADFRDAFIQRYDTREVPLVEALDGEAGVGYGGSAPRSPLLRDVPFPGADGGAGPGRAEGAGANGAGEDAGGRFAEPPAVHRGASAGRPATACCSASSNRRCAPVHGRSTSPATTARRCARPVTHRRCRMRSRSGARCSPRRMRRSIEASSGCCSAVAGARRGRGCSGDSATPTPASTRSSSSTCAPRRPPTPRRRSPRSSTFPPSGWATSSCGRCSGGTRSPTSAAPARPPRRSCP